MGVVFVTYSLYFLCFMLIEAMVNYSGALLFGASPVNVLYLIGLLFTAVGFLLYGVVEAKKGLFDNRNAYVVGLAFVACAFFMNTNNRILFIVAAYGCLLLLGIYGGHAHNRLTEYTDRNHFGSILGICMAASIILQWLIDSLIIGEMAKKTVILSLVFVLAISDYIQSKQDDKGLKKPEKATSDKKSGRFNVGLSIGLVVLMSIILGIEDSLMVEKNAVGSVSLFSYTRLFYALGLVLAGLVADTRKGKYLGMVAACSVVLSAVAIGILGYGELEINLSMGVMYFYCGFYVMFLTYSFVQYATYTGSYLMAGMGRVCRCVATSGTVLFMITLGANLNYSILLIISCVLSMICLFVAFMDFGINNGLFVNGEKKKDNEFVSELSYVKTSDLFTKERYDDFANKYQFTDKEREIFEILITTETATQEIADQLAISRRGLQRHVAAIYEKTGTQTRVGLLISFANQ